MQKPLIEDEMDPRLPSINDPFNLFGCNELPFPLTPSEDIILKHILGICSSDYQMSKRAYDSIICMWAKKGSCIPPVATTVYPTDITIPQIGNYVQIQVYGTNILPGANILYKGVLALNPTVSETGGQGGPGLHVSATADFTDTTKFVTSNIPICVINPSKVISNAITKLVTLLPV